MRTLTLAALLTAVLSLVAAPNSPAPRWLLGRAYKVPSEYANQESGYFSIVEGQNGRLYLGTAKYGVNAYLIEFDPKAGTMRMVLDVHKTIGSDAKGFAAQAKLHTRNNVGASGKIYVGSKQGYPEKGEQRTDYPGGYVLTYDPATGACEHFGIAKPHHGIISVMPDEQRGVAYVSTCSDDRPIDHTHFMILDLKKRTYRDLGDLEHAYAFIVLDHQGRAYHPIRGGQIARYDPDADKLERLNVTVDGDTPPAAITRDGAILNWEVAPDRKTLYAIEMTTNQLFAFDLTAAGGTIPGRRLGALLAGHGIGGQGALVWPDRPTATKTRILAEDPSGHRQQLLRLDRLPPRQLDAAADAALVRRLEELAPRADALLLSDYKGGVVSPAVVRAAVALGQRLGIPVTVDSQGELERFRGCTLVKANLADTAASLGAPLRTDDEVGAAGRRLVAELGARGVVITRGAAGLTAVDAAGACVHVPADRTEVRDVTGAGDTVIAVLTLALLGGGSLEEAARLANHAAGLVVRRLGVATVSPAELLRAVGG